MPFTTEEDLIKSRPLLFESRPFTRIPKRTLPLVPPPTTSALPADFLPLLTSLSRLQLLAATTTREVQRYQQSAQNITTLSVEAHQKLQSLHEELVEAQRQKEYRLEYDEIAEGILKSGLKDRSEMEVSIERLRDEIRALEGEREEYGRVWEKRKATFDGVVGELEVMWGQIKEEKEEHERREGMEEDNEAGRGTEEVEEGEEEEEGEEGEELEEAKRERGRSATGEQQQGGKGREGKTVGTGDEMDLS